MKTVVGKDNQKIIPVINYLKAPQSDRDFLTTTNLKASPLSSKDSAAKIILESLENEKPPQKSLRSTGKNSLKSGKIGESDTENFQVSVKKWAISQGENEKNEFLRLYRANKTLVEGKNWFLISAEWFVKWRNFVGLVLEEGNADLPFNHLCSYFEVERLEYIDNSSLIDFTFVDDFVKDEFHPSFYSLRSDLQANVDFILIPEEAYNLFKDRYNPKQNILRTVVKTSKNHLKIEVFLKKITFSYTSSNSLIIKNCLTTRYTTFQNLFTLLFKNTDLAKFIFAGKLKIFVVDLAEISIPEFEDAFKSQNFPIYVSDVKAINPMEIISHMVISDSQILFITNENKSFFSDDLSIQQMPSISKEKKSRKKFDFFCCFRKSESEENGEVMKTLLKQNPQTKRNVSTVSNNSSPIYLNRNMLKGLENIGNTCFINSIIQCISNFDEIISIFLTGEYFSRLKDKLNQGELSKAYAELLRVLKDGKKHSAKPLKLISLIQETSTLFEKNKANDSHEFLTFFINTLHEELNEIPKKNMHSTKISMDASILQENNDDQIAATNWKNFKSMNKSVFSDLMYGQHKSTLICPKCQEISYSFDPFFCLNLPIPDVSQRIIEILFVWNDFNQSLVLVSSFAGDFTSVAEVTTKIGAYFNRKPNEIVPFDIDNLEKPVVLSEYSKIDLKKKLYFYQIPDRKKEFLYLSINFESFSKETFPKIIGIDLNLSVSNIIDTIHNYLKLFFENFGISDDRIRYKDLYKIFSFSNFFVPCFVCNKKNCNTCEITPEMERFDRKLEILQLRVSISNDFKSKIDLKSLMRIVKLDLCQNAQIKQTVSIYDCLQAFKNSEVLDEKNKWFCKNCSKNVKATKKLEIFKLPTILIINFKRFKILGNKKEKIEVPIEFPCENLQISEKDSKIYDLYAVSNHYGDSDSGHYTASVLHKGLWFECNDLEVCQIHDISKTSAYILFYKSRT